MAPKRLPALALALLFAVSFAAPSGARALSAGGFEYTVASGVATVTGCTNTCPADLVIPATLGGYPVTSIGDRAFVTSRLTSVTIPNGVTTIGAYAFGHYGWNSSDNLLLTSVTIPDSVTTIGNYAFTCNKINTVTIGNSVRSIGDFAFEQNSIANVAIPASVTSIGTYAFMHNVLTTVIIPNSITSISEGAFDSNQITNVTIPTSVTSIGASAFYSNLLATVTIPTSVTSIGDSAFARNLLATLTIPNSVTSIGASAFGNNKLTSMTIPNSITSISNGMFISNLLATVTIPTSVTSIAGSAFSNNLLTTVEIPDSVTRIGDRAFTANKLTTVMIPNWVTTIEYGAFMGNLLTTVMVGGSVTSIGTYAFRNNRLTSVIFLGNAPTPGRDVFSDNPLEEVFAYPGTTGWGETWGGIAVRVLDLTPPQTTLTRTGPTPSSDVVNFILSSDETATFECNLDDAGWSACYSSYTTPQLADGTHVLLARATDSAGNVDLTPAREEWVVDTTPPETTIDSAPSSTSSDAVATFTFSGSDNLSSFTFECSVDEGSYAACTSPFSTATLTAGSHTFAVRAVDAAGRTDGSPATYSWVIDLTPPQTTLTRTGPTPSSDVVSFDLSSDEAASFECNLDDAGWTACNTSYTTPYLADGTHVLLARATDTAGNVDPTPAREEWVVDTTPPETTIDSAPSSTSSDAVATFTFSGSDNLSSFTFECSVDEGSYAACTSPFSTATLTAGSHTFAVRAVDAAGRTDGSPATYSWVVEVALSGLPSTNRTTALWSCLILFCAALFAIAGIDARLRGAKRA